MPRKYTDLSNFKATFDPLTNSDKRWGKIFRDEYARIIFVGYKLHHLVDSNGLNTLKNESLKIADEIRNQKIELNHDSVKERLRKMYCKINDNVDGGDAKLDINDEFVDYLLPYLNKEKNFGYEIIQR